MCKVFTYQWVARPMSFCFLIPVHIQFEFPSATMDFNTYHFSLWKKCLYKLHKTLCNIIQSFTLHLYAVSSKQSYFHPNMAKHASFFLYNVIAHFLPWWKTLVSHKILRLLITLEARPEPSFTKTAWNKVNNKAMKIWKMWKKNCCKALITEILVTNYMCLCSN